MNDDWYILLWLIIWYSGSRGKTHFSLIITKELAKDKNVSGINGTFGRKDGYSSSRRYLLQRWSV